MGRPRVLQSLTALLVLSAGIGYAQTGYWQYLRTDKYIVPDPGGTYPDTYTGTEGYLTVTYGVGVQTWRFGALFQWSPPPSILVQGTNIYWPAQATITANSGTNPPYSGFEFTANLYPYQNVEDLTTNPGGSAPYLINLWPDNGLSSSNTVGAVISYNNATQTQPTPIPGASGGDANGLMAILLKVSATDVFEYSYILRLVRRIRG